jgi:hypothetical protein
MPSAEIASYKPTGKHCGVREATTLAAPPDIAAKRGTYALGYRPEFVFLDSELLDL